MSRKANVQKHSLLKPWKLLNWQLQRWPNVTAANSRQETQQKEKMPPHSLKWDVGSAAPDVGRDSAMLAAPGRGIPRALWTWATVVELGFGFWAQTECERTHCTWAAPCIAIKARNLSTQTWSIRACSNLVQWKVALPVAGGLELRDL